MLNIIRPELKHLKQIVLLSKDVYGSKAPDHVLHDFFKSLLVKDGYDNHLETIKNNLITWAKENKASKVIFVIVDKDDSIQGMPKGFKKLGSLYGVEL